MIREEDGDGDETVDIGPIGHVVNFNLGALRETLRDRDGRSYALGSLHAGYYAEPALRESGKLGAVFTVEEGGGRARSAARHAGPHQKCGRRT